jgi:hypothetical protein
MPLYPHSILKKPKDVGVVKAANKEPDVVPAEAEGDVFDRPAAQPGKTLRPYFGIFQPFFLLFYIFFTL